MGVVSTAERRAEGANKGERERVRRRVSSPWPAFHPVITRVRRGGSRCGGFGLDLGTHDELPEERTHLGERGRLEDEQVDARVVLRPELRARERAIERRAAGVDGRGGRGGAGREVVVRDRDALDMAGARTRRAQGPLRVPEARRVIRKIARAAS